MKTTKLKAVMAGMLLAVMFIAGGCSVLPGRGGSSGNRDLTDKYKSAEEFCEYWYGPCEETGSHDLSDDSDTIVYEIKDLEYGFEYTVRSNGKGFYFGSDFAHYYIKEFLSRADLEDITKEFDLKFESSDPSKMGRSPSIKISTERELSAEDNKKILDVVMSKLDQFDSERRVFNKKEDNLSAAISVWSAPWEHDKKTKALYHVENDTFGDNYKEQ